jgi:probable rRNA maturation factor
MIEKDLQPIHFHFVDISISIKNRKQLKDYLKKIAKREGYTIQLLNYIFCSDSYLLKLNQQFLNHNTLTDILTFPSSSSKDQITAEVYISIDRIRDNAKTYKTLINHELHRVIFHGLLHLCGFKDKSASDKTLMRKKEDFYLNKYFVSRGTS